MTMLLPIETMIHHLEEMCAEDPAFAKCYEKSIHILDRSIDLYGLSGMCFSFNGGKDSTVVFHLIRLALAYRYFRDEGNNSVKNSVSQSTSNYRDLPTLNSSHTSSPSPKDQINVDKYINKKMQELNLIYFQITDQFPEILQFLNSMKEWYHVKYSYWQGNYVEEIKKLQQSNDKIKGFIMYKD